jgi:hypothetical protein
MMVAVIIAHFSSITIYAPKADDLNVRVKRKELHHIKN